MRRTLKTLQISITQEPIVIDSESTPLLLGVPLAVASHFNTANPAATCIIGPLVEIPVMLALVHLAFFFQRRLTFKGTSSVDWAGLPRSGSAQHSKTCETNPNLRLSKVVNEARKHQNHHVMQHRF